MEALGCPGFDRDVGVLANLGERLKALEAQGRAAMRQREARQQARGRLDELKAWCHTVAANLVDLSYVQKRLALDALGVRVTTWRKDDGPPKIQADIPLGAT